MVSTRSGSRGFMLIELLVTVATTSVQIGLLLPAVKSVREAAATQATLELRNKSCADAALCTPPYRNSLDGNARDVHLNFPAIPNDIVSAAVAASGLLVRYDPTALDTQPFGLIPWSDANSHDPGIVTPELIAYALDRQRLRCRSGRLAGRNGRASPQGGFRFWCRPGG